VLSFNFFLLPKPASADNGFLEQAELYTKEAISYGEGRNAGFAQRYAEAALVQAGAAEKAQPNPLLEDAMSRLNAAAAEAKYGFVDTATAYAEAALKLLEEVSSKR